MISRNLKAFTLVELIISVGLFAVVATIAAAAYLNLINLERRTRDTSDMVNNLSFAVDSMSRAIRTGTNYNCVPSGSPTTCSEFTFTDSSGCNIEYELNTSGSVPTIDQVGQDTSSGCDTTTASPIIDSRISITELHFYVYGLSSGSTDNTQPQVTITLTGSIPVAPNEPAVNFTIETSATSRIIDI